MTKVENVSPLIITRKARDYLSAVRATKKISVKHRLRVRSHVNEAIGILGFDMSFDDVKTAGDMVYKMDTIELVLDCDTAYHLVGSVLDVDTKGDLSFKHLAHVDNFQSVDKIIFD